MHFAPAAMHIPDGFLSVVVALFFWLVSAAILAAALKRTNQNLGSRQAPLMGVLAAAIFAGQMLNFTVAGGTSGHLLGAALAVILLGPWPAVIVMAVVVAVQALVFQDGGLLALGANLFNMSFVGVFTAWLGYRLVQWAARGKRWGTILGSFAAGWISIFCAALACGLQLAISGTSPANVAVPAMAGIHAVIGIGEGLITVGAVAFLYAARRDLVEGGQESAGGRGVLVGGAAAALLLAVLAPLASVHPDGLERVAEQYGFIELAGKPLYSLIPDYLMPGLSNEAAATIAAGIVGGLVVFTVMRLISRPDKIEDGRAEATNR